MEAVNLYESGALRAVTGELIRPGGFELTDRGLSRCHLARGERALDIGCGTGAGVRRMRSRYGLAAMGLDLSAVLLAQGAENRGGSPLVRGRAEALPVAGGSIRAAVCECVLSLCTDPQRVLEEVWRVLAPDGHLVLSDVYARPPKTRILPGKPLIHCCLQGAVDRETIESRIAAAGFELVLWEDHTPLLKQLAARLVWTYGSLDAFWSAIAGPQAAHAMSRQGANTCGHPGYYLAVAQKRSPGKSEGAHHQRQISGHTGTGVRYG
jgi:arsenite methyltransferase